MKKITKAFVISACMPIAFACFGCGDTDKQSYALFSEPVVTVYIIDDNFRQVGVYGETESIKVDGKFVYKLNCRQKVLYKGRRNRLSRLFAERNRRRRRVANRLRRGIYCYDPT